MGDVVGGMVVDAFKRRISNRFGSASRTYDRVGSVQKACAQYLVESLVEQMSDFSPRTILDVGTGTGFLPELLSGVFPHAHWTLNDISSEMLEVAREKLGNEMHLTLCLGDIETVPIAPHDLIVSSLTLQWVASLEQILKKLYASSRVLAFSCTLQGTFREWESFLVSKGALCAGKKSPSEEDILSILRALSPRSLWHTTKTYVRTFRGAKAFMSYLRDLGASASSAEESLTVLRSLLKEEESEITATYNVFFGVVVS